jgi:hypothetical protein
MIVRDNYFGSFTNFTTREEYLDKKLQNAIGDPVELKYRKGKVWHAPHFKITITESILVQRFRDSSYGSRAGWFSCGASRII